MTHRPAADPRWDEPGFNVWAGYRKNGKNAWVKLGYMRKVAASGGVLIRRQELEAVPGALHLGVPPREVSLFSLNRVWETRWNPDPRGEHLREIVTILDGIGAKDEDLIFNDFCCVMHESPQVPYPAEESELYRHALEGMERLFTYSRIRAIVLPRMSASAKNPHLLLDRGWTMFELFLASYCTRLLYSRGPGNEDVEEIVSRGTDPVRLSNVRQLFNSVYFSERNTIGGAGTSGKQREKAVRMIANSFACMPAAPEDAFGFGRFCEQSNIAWVLVSTIRELAESPGPFPRRQDLDHGAYIVGMPPASCRKFVVSHGWESEVHPSPGGAKMVRLVGTLDAAGAKDTDVVFFDFMSNTQEAKIGDASKGHTATEYFRYNRLPSAPLAGRTTMEKRAFEYAMWDMGRLYSFRECEVLVLPSLNPASTFPGRASEWGFENTRPYHKRGWCCSEFAIALKNKRIANLTDPDVMAVVKSRKWPTDVAAYGEMMDESLPDATRVDFTHKGDRAVVKYNFFKMTMSRDSLGV